MTRARQEALGLHVIPDFGSIQGWPIREIFIFSNPFSLKGEEQTQIPPTLHQRSFLQKLPNYLKTPQISGKQWVGFGLWLFPKWASQERELRVRTELQCRNCARAPHTLLPHCGQCSTEPSSDMCTKPTSPKAFAVSSSSLQKMSTLQTAKRSLI